MNEQINTSSNYEYWEVKPKPLNSVVVLAWLAYAYRIKVLKGVQDHASKR